MNAMPGVILMKKKLLKYIVIAVGISNVASANGYACVGARPMAMGGAFIAVADDINTTYWNPAGLTFVLDWEDERSELTYTALLNRRDELRYNDFASFVTPFHLGEWAEGGFGFSYVNTRNLLREGAWGKLDWTERWYWISLGTELFPGFSMGVNLRSQFEEEKLRVRTGQSHTHRGVTVSGPAYRRWEDDAFGVDVALLGRWGMFSVGVLYQNANEPEIFGRRYIANLRPGIAIRPDNETVIAIDMYDALGKTERIPGNVSGFLCIGIERWIGNSAVRAGAYLLNLDTWEPKAYTFGIGHRIIEWEGIFANIELNYTAKYWRAVPPRVDRYTHQLGFAIRR
jgi:hypothetical protein